MPIATLLLLGVIASHGASTLDATAVGAALTCIDSSSAPSSSIPGDEIDSPLRAAYRAPESSIDPASTMRIRPLSGEGMCCDANLAPLVGAIDAPGRSVGEWTIGYRYMFSRYQGMRDGTHHLSSEEVLAQGFAQSPTSMTMQMHEVDAMYGVSERFSLMVCVPYVLQSMPQVDNMGDKFTTHSSGIGDVSISAMYAVPVREVDRCIATLGVSIPTGSIDQRDDMPGCPDCRLEYMMQNGSGTVDLLPSVAYVSSIDRWSFGAQAEGRVRLGTNDNGYRLGDRGELTAWSGYRWSDAWRGLLRVNGSVWGNVTGADPELDPMMSPTNDANRQGGRRIDVALGLDWLFGHSGSGAGFEVGVPVYQNLDGPQLDAQWFATAGLHFAF
jgi:hypothetical protein